MKTDPAIRRLTTLAAAVLLATGLGTALASTADKASQDLLAQLRSLYPATHFKSVSTTPLPGVFEVAMGANLAYVDAAGRHFLFGHLYDMREQRDLTAERRQVLSRIDVKDLPLSDAITEVRGNGSRFLAVFSDPDCPYCKRLEVDLQDMTDVTIHTFVMPLSSLHPQARDKAIKVWCASGPDAAGSSDSHQRMAARVEAWHVLMRRSSQSGAGTVDRQVPQATADCDHPIDRNVELGRSLGIHGTPTLVAGDGRMLQGASGLQQVEAWLDAHIPKATTRVQP
jgi:thiol:disulfide interchange protein DsbC